MTSREATGESVTAEVDVLALVRGPLEKVIGKPATDAVYNLRAQRDALEAEVERLRALLQRAHDDLLTEFGREELSAGKYDHPDRIDLLFQAIEAALFGSSRALGDEPT